MRFVFCAMAVCFLLQDWRFVDLDRAERYGPLMPPRPHAPRYILSSVSFDGGIGLAPGAVGRAPRPLTPLARADQESHGGSTFCAVAALQLMGRLQGLDQDALVEFLVRRQVRVRPEEPRTHAQVHGFNGRVNKPPDTCYSFWVGGTLQTLSCAHLIDRASTRDFLYATQRERTGGFAKTESAPRPDPLHAYYGVCGLSLIEEEGVKPLHATLGCSQEVWKRLVSAGVRDGAGRRAVGEWGPEYKAH